MFVVQFLKYCLCIVLLFVACTVLIKVKRSFNVKETINVSSTKHQLPMLAHFPIPDMKNMEFEINTPQMDKLKDEIIDLQKSTSLLQQVSNICAKYKLKTPVVKRHFLYNVEHKSLYCWIHKVASTSFIKLFSDMSNRRIDRNFYKEVDFLSLKSLGELLFINNTVFKLLVVRHPFQRLVSSYRFTALNPKFMASNVTWELEKKSEYRFCHNSKIASRIIANIPHSPGSTLARSFIFQEVNSFVPIDRVVSCREYSCQTKGVQLRIVPSFREFLEWLLRQSPDHDDVHWDQYHTHCAVCNVSYNFIFKLDEYTTGEANYVLSKLKLDGNKIYLPRLQRTRAGITDFNVTCRYFRGLTTDIVLRLYKRYKVDFEMYNYDLDKYLHCAKRKNLL